jgi:hypothetical protein
MRGVEECVEWPFTRSPAGYGKGPVFKDWRTRLIHRIVCEMVHGEPPTAKHHAAHKCGNRACCNSAHLYWATAQENANDRIEHGTSCRGPKHCAALFTDEDVVVIRIDYANGATLRSLAQRFLCDMRTISRIVRGEIYADTAGPITKATNSSRALKGEGVGTSKLTVSKVRALRKRREDTPTPTFRQLGLEFGISTSLAYAVISRKVWAHVD